MATGPRHHSMHDARMWEEFGKDRLVLQQCADCSAFRYPPASCCPHCLSTGFGWTEVSGKAKVVSWTTFHRQYLPAFPAPASVVVVQLAEGPMMVTHVSQQDVVRLTLDAEVEARFVDHPDGYRLPMFALADRPDP